MNMEEETTRQIQELQIIEQNLQSFLMEKQSLQIELNEVTNALQEISKADDEVYKVVGNIMVKTEKKSLDLELKEKKKILELRISSVEKQESLVGGKAVSLREELTKKMSQKKQ